ncbi:MAG: S41 family peptidase, partial [Oscillospiraceae bacterium]
YENMCREAYKRLGVNDYGLSMLTLSDGSAAAVNVDASLNSLGIHNGTVITAWDGEDVFAAAENSVVFSCVCYPDIDNEKFFLPAFAACTGGETVSVSFIDDGGSERTETLRLLGDGYDRLNDTLKAVTQGYPAANFEWADIDESTVLLRIKAMQFDSKSSQSENYDRMKQQLTEACAENLQNGKTNLIIDLRSNSGGSGLLVKALGEVFSPPGEHFYCCDGTWDTKTLSYRYDEDSGTFPISATNTFVGENRWQGNKILILVNSDSISAADHLVTIMRGLENVTVMGFTETNGSAQGVGQLPLERGTLSFSGSLVLNADGTPFVDTGADRESGNDIDIRVPLDSQAVTAIFDKGEDYLLSKAVEFFG